MRDITSLPKSDAESRLPSWSNAIDRIAWTINGIAETQVGFLRARAAKLIRQDLVASDIGGSALTIVHLCIFIRPTGGNNQGERGSSAVEASTRLVGANYLAPTTWR